MQAHREAIADLTFAPKDNVFASGSRDGIIRVWAVGKKEPLVTLKAGKVTSLSFNERGNLLAFAAEDAPITVWDLKSGKAAAKIERTEGCSSVAFLRKATR